MKHPHFTTTSTSEMVHPPMEHDIFCGNQRVEYNTPYKLRNYPIHVSAVLPRLFLISKLPSALQRYFPPLYSLRSGFQKEHYTWVVSLETGLLVSASTLCLLVTTETWVAINIWNNWVTVSTSYFQEHKRLQMKKCTIIKKHVTPLGKQISPQSILFSWQFSL